MKKTTLIIKKRDLKKEKRRRLLSLCGMLLVMVLSVAALSAVFTSDASDDTDRMKYYTSVEVHKGDTVWSIAGAYMTDDISDKGAYVHEICALNHLDDAAEIHAGEHLVIPYYDFIR